ncbi:hypothetical protein [Brachyspira sp.]|uniref:hypothetical protein n=1 Tax=Brachyspira sp. TaxID=1977261 RepID=UPI002621E235|nr:hypothetical protein [Brachyspira sp.]
MNSINKAHIHIKEVAQTEIKAKEEKEVAQAEIEVVNENNVNQILKPIDINNLVNNVSKLTPEIIKGSKNDQIFQAYMGGFKNAKTYKEKELLSKTVLKFQKEANTHQRIIISSFSRPLCVGVGIGVGIGIVALVRIAICDNKK